MSAGNLRSRRDQHGLDGLLDGLLRMEADNVILLVGVGGKKLRGAKIGSGGPEKLPGFL